MPKRPFSLSNWGVRHAKPSAARGGVPPVGRPHLDPDTPPKRAGLGASAPGRRVWAPVRGLQCTYLVGTAQAPNTTQEQQGRPIAPGLFWAINWVHGAPAVPLSTSRTPPVGQGRRPRSANPCTRYRDRNCALGQHIKPARRSRKISPGLRKEARPPRYTCGSYWPTLSWRCLPPAWPVTGPAYGPVAEK